MNEGMLSFTLVQPRIIVDVLGAIGFKDSFYFNSHQ